MRYIVKHTTEYTYQYPTTVCYNEAWMFPRDLPYQKIISSHLRTSPQYQELNFREDFFGNKFAYLSLQQPHLEFRITVESILERVVPTNIDPNNISYISWKEIQSQLKSSNTNLIKERSYVLPSPMVPNLELLRDYAQLSFDRHSTMYDAVLDLNTRIYHDFEYNTEFTTIATPLIDVAKAKKGVCQDFAHIAIGCLRSLGLSARYVSGYIETLSPEGEPKLIGTAASHAWFATFIPEMGWVDFDPTNNQLAKDQHITVAWGRDYQDVPPLKGVIYNSANHELTVGVEVKRLVEKA